MSNTVRMASGNQVIVRTGVLAGIGPAGPTGPQGLRGPQGSIGPQGPPGPKGYIESVLTKADSTTTMFVLNSSQDTPAQFSVTQVDDLAMVKSTTVLRPPNGVFYWVATVTMHLPSGSTPTGLRTMRVTYDGAQVASQTVPAVGNAPTTIQLSGFLDARQNFDKALQVMLRQTDAKPISVGCCIEVTKIGPGPQGDRGPVGPEGIQGPVGPVGPAGAPGNIVDADTTYGDVGG